ncbi:zinc finger protein 658-like, partial [Carlito syrichta]|uniref:Zinc finger protein 658-like n=1 Tax=Carlito syrichta TaxID=1868482 RepID=A0A3Q0DSQ3_CARSF
MRTDTREKYSDLNECGKCCDKATIVEYNKVHMAMTHHKFNESEINFSEKSSLIQSQRTVTEQSALESSKCEDNFSQSSAHMVPQKTQTGREKFCEYNGCTNIFYQKLDLTIHQRTHTEEQFCCSGEYGRCRKSFHQKGHLIWYQRTHSGEKLQYEE